MTAGGGDHERAALIGRGGRVGEGEVSEPVVDVGRTETATAEQHVGVTADDDVGSRLHQLVGQRLQKRVRAGVELDAPVEEDDDGVVETMLRFTPDKRAGTPVPRAVAGSAADGRRDCCGRRS
jgi:hypothetical protein